MYGHMLTNPCKDNNNSTLHHRKMGPPSPLCTETERQAICFGNKFFPSSTANSIRLLAFTRESSPAELGSESRNDEPKCSHCAVKCWRAG